MSKAIDRRAELVGVLEQLPPGRYRAILTVTKIRRRRGRELAELVLERAVDVTIRRRQLGAARARPALPPSEP